jgi:hypothetical protein
MNKNSELVVYSGSGEWSALYIDGKLDRVGDHYLIDERIRELYSVVTIHSDDFMRGGDQRSGVAIDLAEIRQYRQQREMNEAAARKMVEQAQELIDRAKELDPNVKT